MKHAGLHRQRGNVFVIAAAALGLAVAALMVLDVAHVFTVKRELQKVADLAALAGVRTPGDCTAMVARAESSARANGHEATPDRDASFACGTWSPEDGFAAGAGATAVRVVAGRNVPYFFMAGGSRRVEAEAIARNDAYDVFALGTGLAGVHAGALNALLSAVAGSQVNLDLVAYQGLASAQVSLADLVNVPLLDVGTVDELLDADLRLVDFTLAMAEVLNASSPVAATALQALSLRLPGDLKVRLADILRVDAADRQSAARVGLNALDLLLASAQVATGGRLLDLGASIPPNPLATLGLKLQVIEPPQIAVGREGATARSSQVRLLLHARLVSVNLGVATATALELPIYVEAAPGKATLQRMECAPDQADCAVEFGVETGLARACVGNDGMNQPGGATNACTAPAQLTEVELGLGVLKLARVGVKARAHVQLTNPEVHAVRFEGDEVKGGVRRVEAGAGASTAHLLGSLVRDLRLEPELVLIGLDIGGVLDFLLSGLLTALQELLDDLLVIALEPVLVGLVDPLLSALGVQAGTADLRQIELVCSDAELVH